MDTAISAKPSGPFGLELVVWQSTVDGVARADYHLLLGAGSSIGCLGGDGRTLESAPALAKELVDVFLPGLDATGINLQAAYELAEQSSTPADLVHFFKNRFTNCKPTWQEKLTRLPWHRIWTLNVDDVAENAYRDSGSRRRTRSHIFSDPNREPERDTDELQIIHLHGYARQLDPSDPKLIFSIVEYIRATSAGHTWHRVFGDHFLQYPFIFLGARMVDEMDLAEVLRRGSLSMESTGRPSIIVMKEVGSANQLLFERWGLRVVISTAEEFIDAILRELPEALKRVSALLPPTKGARQDLRATQFLQQFRWLKADQATAPKNHDFYRGEDPDWSDIVSKLDAEFVCSNRIVKSVCERLSANTDEIAQIVGCINGPPGCGKSTVLLRTGRKFISQNYDVFLFRGEERLNINSVVWWLSQQPKSVILIDGVTDVARDLGELARRCKAERLPLVVLGAERESRLSAVYSDIDPAFLCLDYPFKFDHLTGEDISSLVGKLRSERRLGQLTRLEDEQVRSHFRKYASRQLIVGMMRLNSSRGFEDRLIDEYQLDITNPNLRLLYSACCLTYQFGYALPLGIASVVTGLDVLKINKALQTAGELKGVVFLDEIGLRPRHRVIASKVIESALDKPERYGLTLLLAKALSPHISKQTMFARTVPARISRHLCDADFLQKSIGLKAASKWYSEMTDDFSWNSRFWEQRALTEVRLKNYLKARDWAEEAVKIQDHTFTRTTLATILMKMAFEYHQPGTPASTDAFWTAVEHLKEARDRAEQPSEHEYTTFFNYALRFATEFRRGRDVDTDLLKEWSEWMSIAERTRVFLHRVKQEELSEYKIRWMRARSIQS